MPHDTCLLLCRTQVFGPDDLGTRRHPFFLMGLKLQPDDPRGWDWFTPRAARQRWDRCVTPCHVKTGCLLVAVLGQVRATVPESWRFLGAALNGGRDQ